MVSIETSKTALKPCPSPPRGPAALTMGKTGEQTFRLGFVGTLTIATSHDFEKEIVNALQHYRHLELDLAGVSEIDHYGIHLLVLLHRVADREIVIIDSSPAVDAVSRRLFAPPFAPKARS